MTITELKTKSIEQLKGYWGMAVGVTAIYIVISAIIRELLGKIPFNGVIAESVLLSFFTLGIIAFMFNVINKKAQITDIFSQSNIWPKAVVISLIQGAAGFILYFILKIDVRTIDNAALLGLYSLLTLSLSVLSIIIGLMFALSTTILVDKPETSIMDALKESNQLMKGNKIRYILLFLSFIGWFVLALFTVGIGLLWLIPYVQMASVNFYLDLKNKNL